MFEKMKYILEICNDLGYNVSFFFDDIPNLGEKGICTKVVVNGSFYNYEGTVNDVYKKICDEFD